MNDKKISFICNVQDEDNFSESLRYISRLVVPEGFEIEILPVSGAHNIAAGYNFAMAQTDAKYKVFMTEHDYLVDPSLLVNLISVFQAHPELAAIGPAGMKDIPLSGRFSEAQYRFGRLYTNESGTMTEECDQEPAADFEPVSLVNGILATQMDMEWKEDVFETRRYTIASQCVQLLAEGLEIGVLKQSVPWLLTDVDEADETGMQKADNIRFLDLYSPVLFPKVSILIPTYNRPELFELALRSALEQTYRNMEIVVCDDSTNDLTNDLIQPYLAAYPSIRYYKNETNLGQFENDLKLIALSEGEYINFLMDDDLFHPEKIEKMMQYYLGADGEEITLVTSHRGRINEHGDHLPDILATRIMFSGDTLEQGNVFGDIMLMHVLNFVGEPTTVLFRKKDLEVPFGTFANRKYGCNVDAAAWLNLLSIGKAVYINETLSYFRTHSNQQLATLKMQLFGATDYAHEVLHARESGFLLQDADYKVAITSCLKYADQVTAGLSNVEKGMPEFQELQTYLEELRRLLKSIEEAELAGQPLVSVLIPTYNRPELLELALDSVLNQTYKNIEIIISDDSTNDLTQEMIQPYLMKYPNIKYIKNPYSLEEKNFEQCFNLASGMYVNFLMDDDLFHIEKIERMVRILESNEKVTLVTSVRELIDEHGAILPPQPDTVRLFEEDTIVSGDIIANFILENLTNIVGEPTTVLFRKGDIDVFGSYYGKSYTVLNDLATWMTLMKKGSVAYIAQPLSYFRKHSGQNQVNPRFFYRNVFDWFNIIHDGKQDGFLNVESKYASSITKYLNFVIQRVVPLYKSLNLESMLVEYKVQQYVDEALEILLHYHDKYYCPYCNQRFNEFRPWSDIYDFPKYIFEMSNKYTAICPNCESMDRERLYKLYIEKETDLLTQQHSVLHLAPERKLRRFLQGFLPSDRYVCGDLYPTDPSIIKMDATELPFDSNTFDVIFCSHVLEHIPDDNLAMKEFYRVLRPGGWGILQVPIALDLDETYEDWSITTDEGRLEAFGQIDHVRVYGQDYVKRLEKAGFRVEKYNYGEKYGYKEAEKYGLSENDNLYVVKKL